ncbi:tyrosine-type recombinase/integrase [Micropruina sp.]|uniref:tyrosine-type recombinase/integrase n=1 Tax=Micropruina sp. TaxID=2737536 RepID=UPI0039E3B44C
MRTGVAGFSLWTDELRSCRVAAYSVGSQLLREEGDAFAVVPVFECRLLGRLLRPRRQEDGLHTQGGDIVEVAGWIGVRWGELRALRVSDVQRVPMLGLHVTKSQTEGGKVKPTKAYATRLVPLPQQIWPTVQRLMQGKSPNDFLITGPSGGQLWTGTFRRAVKWNVNGRGRRPHDLRHTAACLWLARGVDVGTVQKWCGHRSIATTNIYLHWLGTAADKSALALLNSPRQTPGTGAEVAVLPAQAGQ